MKAVLSTAISTSSVSSSCVSCFCEGRKGRGETKSPRKPESAEHAPSSGSRTRAHLTRDLQVSERLAMQQPESTEHAPSTGSHSNLSYTLSSSPSSPKNVYMAQSHQTLMQHCKSTTGSSAGEESTCSAGDPGSILGSGRSAGEGKGDTLQCCGLENSVDYITVSQT